MFRLVGVGLAFASIALTGGAFAQAPGSAMPVTVDNFLRADKSQHGVRTGRLSARNAAVWQFVT